MPKIERRGGDAAGSPAQRLGEFPSGERDRRDFSQRSMRTQLTSIERCFRRDGEMVEGAGELMRETETADLQKA